YESPRFKKRVLSVKAKWKQRKADDKAQAREKGITGQAYKATPGYKRIKDDYDATKHTFLNDIEARYNSAYSKDTKDDNVYELLRAGKQVPLVQALRAERSMRLFWRHRSLNGKPVAAEIIDGNDPAVRWNTA